MKLLEGAGWWVFFGLGPILWASGVWLFLRSPLTPAKKIGWSLLLLAVGVAIGGLLSLAQIRDRFLILLAERRQATVSPAAPPGSKPPPAPPVRWRPPSRAAPDA